MKLTYVQPVTGVATHTAYGLSVSKPRTTSSRMPFLSGTISLWITHPVVVRMCASAPFCARRTTIWPLKCAHALLRREIGLYFKKAVTTPSTAGKSKAALPACIGRDDAGHTSGWQCLEISCQRALKVMFAGTCTRPSSKVYLPSEERKLQSTSKGTGMPRRPLYVAVE